MLLIPSIISFIVISSIWILTQNDIAVVVSICSCAVVLIYLCIIAKRRIEAINSDSFYIAQDTLTDFKKRFALPVGRSMMRYKYVYIFREHGKHKDKKSHYKSDIEISFDGKPSVSFPKLSGMEADSIEIGDPYYLLILKVKNKNVVVKCFHRHIYDVYENDFESIDGKYFLKTDR